MSNLRYLKLEQWMWNLSLSKDYYESAYPLIGPSSKKDGIYCHNKGLCYIVVSGQAYQYDYASFMVRLKELDAFEKVNSADDLETLAELELKYFGKLSQRVAERYQSLLRHRVGMKTRKYILEARKRTKPWKRENAS